MREDKVNNATLIKSIGQFLGEDLPSTTTIQAPVLEITAPNSAAVEAVPSASPSKIVYDDGETDVPEYIFGLTASPYLAQYAYDSDSLDKQYGFSKDGDKYRIGNCTVTID
jgi:hypothetical protein